MVLLQCRSHRFDSRSAQWRCTASRVAAKLSSRWLDGCFLWWKHYGGNGVVVVVCYCCIVVLSQWGSRWNEEIKGKDFQIWKVVFMFPWSFPEHNLPRTKFRRIHISRSRQMISRPNPQVIEMSGFVGIDSENGLTIWVGVCRLPSSNHRVRRYEDRWYVIMLFMTVNQLIQPSNFS